MNSVSVYFFHMLVTNIGLFYVWKVYQWTASLWWSVCRELCSVWMQTGVWTCDSYVMCCSDVLLLKATVNKCYLQTESQRYVSLFKEVHLWKLLLQRVFSTMYTCWYFRFSQQWRFKLVVLKLLCLWPKVISTKPIITHQTQHIG